MLVTSLTAILTVVPLIAEDNGTSSVSHYLWEISTVRSFLRLVKEGLLPFIDTVHRVLEGLLALVASLAR